MLFNELVSPLFEDGFNFCNRPSGVDPDAPVTKLISSLALE